MVEWRISRQLREEEEEEKSQIERDSVHNYCQKDI